MLLKRKCLMETIIAKEDYNTSDRIFDEIKT